MTAQQYQMVRSPRLMMFLFVLFLSSLIGAGLVAFDPQPSSAPTWDDIYRHPIFNQMATRLDYGALTPVHLPDGLMPNFPQCDGLDIARWCWRVSEATYKEGHLLNVDLLGDGTSIGNIQLLEMDTQYVEISEAMNGYSDTVWLSAIKVARLARLNGIGRVMWLAGDRVLGYLSGCEGVCSGVYHLFFNSSGSQAWMDSIRRSVFVAGYDVIYENTEMFIYEVPLW